MLVHIPPDAWQVVNRLNPMGRQFIRRADTREEQELGAADGARGNNDLPRRVEIPDLTVSRHADARAAVPFKEQAQRATVRSHGQIGPAPSRPNIG